MIYIEHITFPQVPDNYRRIYPGNVLSNLGLTIFMPENINIIYGSNGSGKSTLLNLIARKIHCDFQIKTDPKVTYDNHECSLISPFNILAEKFLINAYDPMYEKTLPESRKVITSSEVISYISKKMDDNSKLSYSMSREMDRRSNFAWDENGIISDGAMLLKRRTEREAMAKLSLHEKNIYSNGEEMLDYFYEKLEDKGIYFLDEPENCLSPIFQKKLAENILELSRYYDCQFFIATHSPFFLSIPQAKIINLDKRPVTFGDNWYDLDNMKPYFELFGNVNNARKETCGC